MLSSLCRNFGVSRQAYYKHAEQRVRTWFQVEIVVQLVSEIRIRQPRIGGKKLYHMLRDDFKSLEFKLGRDKFLVVLQAERLLISPRKRRQKTTDSSHEQPVYPNLIKGKKLYRPYQAVAADITYIRLEEGFCFLSLITDLVSRVILGWCLSESLDASGPIHALKQARLQMGGLKGCVHHSDRGVQYCSIDYVSLLFRYKMPISMTDVGAPEQNAIAERVNGILKTELLLDATFKNFKTASLAASDAIQIYNYERPHYSLDLLTPMQFLKANQRKK